LCFLFLFLSIILFAYAIRLKLEEKGKQQHLDMGIIPVMPLWDISNFADHAKIKSQAKEINNDSTKNNKISSD